MLVGELILFSPECNFADTTWWNDDRRLIDEFQNRLDWMYLEPARTLNICHQGFASTLLTVCAMDAIVRVTKGETSNVKYRRWLRFNYPNLIKKCPTFYDTYRCGLVHEGRIKGKFGISYDSDEDLFKEYKGHKFINPEILTRQTREAILTNLSRIKTEQSQIDIFRFHLKKILLQYYESMTPAIESFNTFQYYPSEKIEIP